MSAEEQKNVAMKQLGKFVLAVVAFFAVVFASIVWNVATYDQTAEGKAMMKVMEGARK